MTDGDDFGRPFHALTLNVVNHLIDMLAASVEFCRVYVNDQRFSADGCYSDARRIGHPVVSVYNIKFLIFS